MKKRKEKAEKKPGFKKLSKKQIIIIVVAVVALCAAIALSIALPLTLGKPRIAEPSFAPFDPQTDTDVVVGWDKVRGASSYTVEYCFGSRLEENVKSVTTTGTKFFTERKIGVISVRVKAEIGDKATFSDWISMDLPAYKLDDPTVAISDNLEVGWAKVSYLYRESRYDAYQYSFAYKYKLNDPNDPLEIEYYEFPAQSTNRVNLKSIIVSSIKTFYEPGITEWYDVTLTVRVSTLTSLPPMYSTAKLKDNEKFLQTTCEQSDYVYAEFTITKEIYEGLVG